MTTKKKIALLNFPLDNNFGGNLQRYALIKVLTDMGYEVEHLSTQFTFYDYRPLVKRIKTWIKWLLGMLPKGTYPMPIRKIRFDRGMRYVWPFYEKYIPHTQAIYDYDELKTYQDYDIYIVGSDQVWRRSMSGFYPYTSMYFDFVENKEAKKIAYGVSFGTENNELSADEIEQVKSLYKGFLAVSVREKSGLKLLEQYGCTDPQPQVVLDPTLLLERSVYDTLIANANTCAPKGDVFCYVLDMDDKKKSAIQNYAKEHSAKPYYGGIEQDLISIEQWLRNIRDAKYVLTDSYHGVLFSIIFNVPFKFLKNERRGNERVSSIMSLLGIEENSVIMDWKPINMHLHEQREKSLMFLKAAAKG